MFNGKSTKIYTIKRFGLEAFLFEMSKMFEIVVFTASQRLYADKVLDLIDPKHRISHRLYREHCIVINKTYYLKNLKILGRNLSQTIIVDVPKKVCRTTTSQDCSTPRISTGSNSSTGIKRTGSSVAFRPS